MSVHRIHFAVLVIIIALLSFQTIGCGPSGSGTIPASGEPEETTANPGFLSLSLSKNTVKSDNSDFSVITATVLGANRSVIPDVNVVFSTNAGQFSASPVVTDDNGEAQTNFSSGTLDQSNQVATITATVAGLNPSQIPIQIIGSTLEAVTDNNIITDDGSTEAELTITALSAGGISLYNAPIQLSVSGTGSATLSANNGYTDAKGEFTITVTGTSAGNVTITAEGLGATVTQDYTVSDIGTTLRITSPSSDPWSLPTNTDLEIIASAPSQQNVRFATTLGSFSGSSENDQVIEVAVSAGTASVVLKSSLAGVATVQVFDADANSPPPADTLIVAISAPSSEASQVALQVSPSVLPTSSGGIYYTSNLVVTVRNSSDQVVGGAPIQFSILDPTGGGETISPVIVYTDDQGTATSIFKSGSLSTDSQGITIKATSLTANMEIRPEDTQTIIIGGTAGSVVVGQGTSIISAYGDTVYQLPMSVIVTDSDGVPVSGVQVSLSAWPTRYGVGSWVEVEKGKCQPIGPYVQDVYDIDGDGDIFEMISLAASYPNEDTNRNLIEEPGEDINYDGQLTPPSSSVGSLPATVTTDENGVAQFSLYYSKSSAAWIQAEVSATTIVLGTETRSISTFWLRYLETDSCYLPESPYDAP